jgi:hypothetical protein
VLAVVLALSTVWYGLVRGHADHVRMTLGPPLAWAAATGLGGALLIVFGIG